MLLTDKTAIVYGGAGGIGSAVARAFAREGAAVHLAGRTLAKLDTVAEQIRAEGGSAETSEVDALDKQAVDAHADTVAAKSGGIDIAMNVISHGDVQGIPLVDMTLEDYERATGDQRRPHDVPHLDRRGPTHDSTRLGCDPFLRRRR